MNDMVAEYFAAIAMSERAMIFLTCFPDAVNAGKTLECRPRLEHTQV